MTRSSSIPTLQPVTPKQQQLSEYTPTKPHTPIQPITPSSTFMVSYNGQHIESAWTMNHDPTYTHRTPAAMMGQDVQVDKHDTQTGTTKRTPGKITGYKE